MRKKNKRGGFSLMELLIVLIVSAIVVMAIFQISTFVTRQVRLYVERYNMYSQLTYALDTLQTVMPTAIRLSLDDGSKNVFSSKTEEKEDEPFYFWGDKNPWQVTPEVFTDNAQYTLEIDSGTKDLVLRKSSDDGDEKDVLIEGKYQPHMSMKPGDEPNFLFVTLTVTGTEKHLTGLSRSIAQVAGIRFWFVDVIE